MLLRVTVSRDGALLSVMVLMSLVDGRVSDNEVMRIRWIFEKLTGSSLGQDDVLTMAEQVRTDRTDLDAYLGALGESLDLDDRRTVLEAAFGIASADGKVIADEDAMMQRIGRALRLPPEHYNAAVRQLRVARELG